MLRITKYICILFLFFKSSFLYANEDLEKEIQKAYEKFSKKISQINNKGFSESNTQEKEVVIIDSALKEINKALDFVDDFYESGDLENTENTLDFITRSISDIEKLIPQEISSDMTQIDMKSVNQEKIKKIKFVTDSMKKSKNKKLSEFVSKLDSLSNSGLNVYSISYNLNEIGIETLSYEEISNALDSDPSSRSKTFKIIEQDLKNSGLSAKEIEKVKDKVNKVNISNEEIKNADDDPRVNELKNLIEKANNDREKTDQAREQRDAALKAAEEAQVAAKKAQENANSLADQTSKAAKEAIEKAKETAKVAQDAIKKATEASANYNLIKGWLESTEKAIKKIEGSIQGINENYNSLDSIYENSTKAKNLKDISDKDFIRLEGLASRFVPNQNPIKSEINSTVVTPEIQLAQNVYNSAIEAGLSETEAGVLADNAVTRYLDMQFVQQNAIAKFKSQGLSDVEATKKSLEIIQDKYSNWVNNIGFGKESTGKISSVDAWITSVAMAKKAATNFGTLDPNDEQELKASAQATADKVLNEAINQGFSKSEAEQIAKNTFETMFSGLKFAYQTGEALLEKGLSEEEMDEVLSKMLKDRFGTTESDFFTPGNLGDVGDEKAIKFYVTGLGALKYAMANKEKSINPDDVDEVEKMISDTEKLVKERAAKLGITDKSKINKFALDAKNSVMDLYYLGYAIEDYLGGPENTGLCNQDCIDENIDFIIDKFYSQWGSRLFDLTSDELELNVEKIDIYVTGIVITESAEAAKLAKENAEKAVKEAEDTLNKAKELEQKAKEAQAKADQIKDKTSKEYKDALAKAEAAKKAAEVARNAAEKAKNASDEARKAYEAAEKELARLEGELKDLLEGIDRGKLGPGEKGAWDPRETIAQNKDRKMEMSEIKSNKNLSNVMNSMSDKQVYGLLASGVINSDLVNEYIKNGKNAPILACGTSDCEVGDLKYVFEEADREMKMSSIKSNEQLSKVLNSLTDRQAYELIASGAIPSDLVNEYIQNGANAPILPCGSSECSMIEYLNPGSTVGAGEGVDVVGLGEVQGVATDILAATRNTNVKTAAEALGEDLKEAIAEIQSTLDAGAVIRGADGQEISVQEALDSMPEGGKINADGTLEPVPAGSTGGECAGPCPEPDEDGDGNPG